MDSVDIVKLDTEPGKKSIKELRNELKALKDEMSNLDAGSDAFYEIANKAGEVKHQIDEINESVAGASADFGDMLSSGTKTVQGIMGGFQAAQGALTLFGVESEEVTKAIQKMQASMAVIQGLDSIDKGIKGFKKFTTAIKASSNGLGGFKNALIATGLGALVVVLGSIIANWDEFTNAIGLSEEKMNKLGEVVGGVMNVLKGSLQSVTSAITKLVTGDFKGAMQTFKDGFNLKKLYNEGVEQAITKRQEEEQEKRAQASADAFAKYKNQKEEQLNIELEKNKRSTASSEEKLAREIEIEQERLGLYKEGTLEYEQQLTKISQLQAKVGEDERRAAEEKAERERQEREEQEQKEAQELERRKEEEASKIQSLKNSYLTEEELYAQNIQTKRDLLKQSLEDGVIDEQTYAELSKQIDDEVTQHEIDNAEKVKEAQKAKAQLAVQTITTIASNAATILNQLADEQDKNSKEGFENSKKLQIAAATMSMLSGIIGAWNSAMALPAPASFIIGALETATTVALGAMQINKIKQQKFDGGGSSGGAASVSNSAVSSTIIPPVQYSNAVQGAETQQAIGESKAYVSVTEIESVGSRVEVAENESRY